MVGIAEDTDGAGAFESFGEGGARDASIIRDLGVIIGFLLPANRSYLLPYFSAVRVAVRPARRDIPLGDGSTEYSYIGTRLPPIFV